MKHQDYLVKIFGCKSKGKLSGFFTTVPVNCADFREIVNELGDDFCEIIEKVLCNHEENLLSVYIKSGVKYELERIFANEIINNSFIN